MTEAIFLKKSSATRYQKTSAEVSRPNRRGFSLIELLVAIGIIALLTAIGVGVGMRVSNQGKVKATKANMALIINAIDTYYDEFDVYPGDTPGLGAGETRTCKEYVDKDTDPSASMELWGFTQRANYAPPKSRDKLKGLPSDIIGNRDDIDLGDPVQARITFNFMDSYGNAMRYSPRGGLGGTPVLFSAGTDGLFGSIRDSDGDWIKSGTATWTPAEDDKRKEAAEDDIRSDK